MNLIRTRQDVLNEIYEQTETLGKLFPIKNIKKSDVKEEVIYRKNRKSIDKIIEFDKNTGSKIKTTHYDYFNDKKIRSIDEFDIKTGKKVRTTNYVLYKSVDEYDLETGRKVRTINYNVKDDTKISSIQEYDIETGKIVTVSLFKRDGKTVSITKQINPDDDSALNYVHKNSNSVKLEANNLKTRSYDNIISKGNLNSNHVASLIDDLYSSKQVEFANLI